MNEKNADPASHTQSPEIRIYNTYHQENLRVNTDLQRGVDTDEDGDVDGGAGRNIGRHLLMWGGFGQ